MVEDRINSSNIGNNREKESIILACLDICDDMLTARAEKSAAEAQKKDLNNQIEKLNMQIDNLKREIAYFKSPKFIIPSPVSKSKSEVPVGQLCFPPFENAANLEPAVNGLTVANINRGSRKGRAVKAKKG